MNVQSFADDVSNFFPRIQTRHWVLKNHLHIFTEPAPNFIAEFTRNFIAVKNNFAVGRVVKTNDTAPDSRLAGAAFADKSISLARINFKGDAVDRLDRKVARDFKMLTEIFHLKQRLNHNAPPFLNVAIVILILLATRL